MLLKRNNRFNFIPLAFLLAGAPALTTQAATIFPNCFQSIADYQEDFTYEVASTNNYIGHTMLFSHIIATGQPITASCDCPSTLKSTTKIYTATHAGSPLAAGHAPSYGFLTNSVDIDVTGYTDAINSPTGGGLFALNINSYPSMDVSQMNSDSGGISSQEQTATVCNDQTRPTSTTTKRQFKWNVINANLYLTHSILGEEIIPPTLVVQNYACVSDSTITRCPAGAAQQVSNIWFGGKISAPLSCIINAGSTIEVQLGSVAKPAFATQGQPPQGFTLKDVDISYHCDNPAASNEGKIKMTLTADQGVSDSGTALIARMIGRDDVGVRMYDTHGNDVVLDGSIDLPITLDGQGNGTVKMQAAPVSTTSTPPQPGKYEGNITVKMDIR